MMGTILALGPCRLVQVRRRTLAAAVLALAALGGGPAFAAATLTTLVSFNGTDGAQPRGGLTADAAGNLFGTTNLGGATDNGTVFEVAKTASGYASTPTVLVSFCAQHSFGFCLDGSEPDSGLIADAAGNLFGTTQFGGPTKTNTGTVFEVVGSGFAVFAGTPGEPNCLGQSVSALAQRYGGLSAAAAALGYSSVQVLQNAITAYCAG